MTSFQILTAALSLLTAVLAAAMFFSILRRARRDAEVKVLLCFLAGLMVQQTCYAIGGARLAPSADLTNVLLLAFMAHFLGLTYWRVSADRADEEPIFLGLTERQMGFACCVGFFYMILLLLVVARILGWKNQFGTGFVAGLFGGLCPSTQLSAVNQIQQPLPAAP